MSSGRETQAPCSRSFSRERWLVCHQTGNLLRSKSPDSLHAFHLKDLWCHERSVTLLDYHTPPLTPEIDCEPEIADFQLMHICADVLVAVRDATPVHARDCKLQERQARLIHMITFSPTTGPY